MTDDSADVLVLPDDVHGIDAADYAAELRERLPDRRVAYARDRDRVLSLAADAPVMTGLHADDELVETADRLRLFACVFAGVDHLPVDRMADRGVAVTSASGVQAPNAAEHAVGGLLSLVRGFDVARRRKRNREWRTYPTDELAGSTVAVVGMGSIGTAVCERLGPFDVERVGVRHSPEKDGPVERTLGYDDAGRAFAEADHVVLACPLTELTRGLVDDAALRALPPHAVVVNVARGPVVDTAALVDALRGGGVAGAALDVTDPEPLPADHPLWGFENVLVTPHNAGHTPKYFERTADLLAENVDRLASTTDGALREADPDAADLHNGLR
ncbi:hydroxyacid dehydrogenase [Halobacteriales archaeon SW_5_70_135]|nr:MAG: hydroxyacid dehydrogenase [Halobacteriales archaeon SW_5_70_135]